MDIYEQAEAVSLSDLPPELSGGDDDDITDLEPRITAWGFIRAHQNNYLFLPDIYRDDHRLPDKTSKRYPTTCHIGLARFNGGTYKTQADLDLEAAEAKKDEPKVIIDLGRAAWSPVEALEYLERKQKKEAVDQAIKTKTRKVPKTIDEIYWADQQRRAKSPEPTESVRERTEESRRELSKMRAEAALESRRLLSVEENRRAEARERAHADEKAKEQTTRRARQEIAIENRYEFSSPQRCYSVTWDDPLITDIRLVRVVLGPCFSESERRMTEEEQADYWYWKARGVIVEEPIRREI